MHFQHSTVIRSEGRYIGWPTIARGLDSSVFIAFSGPRDAHVCPFGKVFVMRSDDGGKSWGEPVSVSDIPLDLRDTGIAVCHDGTVVVSFLASHYHDYRPMFESFYLKSHPGEVGEQRWSAWEAETQRATPEVLAKWASAYHYPDHPGYPKRQVGFFTVRSHDGGRTWDRPIPSPVSSPHGPIILADGSLLYLGTRQFTPLDGSHGMALAKSSDHGITWNIIASLRSLLAYTGNIPNGISRLGEPHVVECASGRLVAMARNEQTWDPKDPQPSRLWQFDSEDGGKTWSEPKPTGIDGKPPHLTRLSTGELLASYGRRHKPYGQRASLSSNEGKTWSHPHEIVFRNDAPNADLGYTSAIELPTGEILAAYYQPDHLNSPPCISTTRVNSPLRSWFPQTKPSQPENETNSNSERDSFTLGNFGGSGDDS